MLLFLPQIVKQLGLTNMQVGWVSMIPYIFGAVSMVSRTLGSQNDRHRLTLRRVSIKRRSLSMVELSQALSSLLSQRASAGRSVT
jgi:hypothetical protein